MRQIHPLLQRIDHAGSIDDVNVALTEGPIVFGIFESGQGDEVGIGHCSGYALVVLPRNVVAAILRVKRRVLRMVGGDIEVVTGRLCKFKMFLWRPLVLFPISTHLHAWPGILDRIQDEHERATGWALDFAAPSAAQVGLNTGAAVFFELITVGPGVLCMCVSASDQKLILAGGTRFSGNDAKRSAKANGSDEERTCQESFQRILPG